MTEQSKLEMYEQRLREQLEAYQGHSDDVKMAFVERVMASSRGAEDAIQWKADEVISAEAKARWANAILEADANPEIEKDLVELVNEWTERTQSRLMDEVRWVNSSRSTNQYANVNEDVTRAAKGEFVDDLKWTMMVINDIREKQAAADSNPELEELLTRQVRRLRYRKSQYRPDSEKTQKGRQAAETALEALDALEQEMLRHAEDYGIRDEVDEKANERY